MDNSESKIDLVDKLLANEQKSKRFSVISVIVFCLLGLFVFYFAYSLNKTNAKHNKELKVRETVIKKQSDTLAENYRALEIQQVTLLRNSEKYDSLKKAYDTLAILFNAAQSDILNSNPSTANSWLNDLSKQTFGETKTELSKDIKVSLTEKYNQYQERPVIYTVYIQTMPGRFAEVSKSVIQKIKSEKNYKLPGIETIDRVTFNTQVKYFYDEDRQAAEKLASILSRADPYFANKKIPVLKVNLKAPLHQLEIWIGEYQKRDLDKLIQQVPYQKVKQ